MDKNIIAAITLFLLLAPAFCYSQCPVKNAQSKCELQQKTDALDNVLEQLRERTEQLKSYQADVEFLFEQPLFDSQALRKGTLYYARSVKGSKLRMNFQTLKQDDEKQQNYREHFILDGLWLTQIDYQLKTAKRYQTAEPNALADANKPIDTFELLSKNFPIVGFSRVEDLKKQFEITLLLQSESEPSPFIGLHLKVKPGSVYKDDYTSMDFWIDKKTHLPAKIVAISTEEDVYEIRLLKAKINKAIDDSIFDFNIPKGFTVEVTTLKKDIEQNAKAEESQRPHVQ